MSEEDRGNPCLAQSGAQLPYDHACLDVANGWPQQSVELFGQYEACEECSFLDWGSVGPQGKTASLLVGTRSPLQMHYVLNGTVHCNWTKQLEEHVRYQWNISEADLHNCSAVEVKTPADNAYLPIVGALIAFLCFGTLWYIVKFMYKCRLRWRGYYTSGLQNDLGNPDQIVQDESQQPRVHLNQGRYRSIDTFRGICITLMIFVNYGGGRYAIFEHSPWNGITIADVVFPWFMWIMGVSLLVSLRHKMQENMPRLHIAGQVVRRSAILVLLGIVLGSHGGNGVALADLRLPGVLQRLGLCYLFVGLMEAWLYVPPSNTNLPFGWHRLTLEWRCSRIQWTIVGLLILVHTLVTFLLPLGEHCPRGYLGPGGLHHYGQFANCTGGAAGAIDRAIFGRHMYRRPTSQRVYGGSLPHDPEGLLGTLTSILMVYMGVHAGRIMTMWRTRSAVLRWLSMALVTGLLGGLLCSFSFGSHGGSPIPLNKNLFSLSFVLCTSSAAFCLQALLYGLVDKKKKWGGRPFYYSGMNALFLYVGHELLRKTFPFGWKAVYGTHREYLAMNLCGTTLWIVVGVWLYRKGKIFTI